MNLVDLVKDQLTSQVLGSLGSLVGTNESQTKAATAAAVPALLGGLSKLAGTAQGAGQIANALDKKAENARELGLTYDDDTMCYRNDVLEEVARALEAFHIPFGQDTINSFATFIRDMKR